MVYRGRREERQSYTRDTQKSCLYEPREGGLYLSDLEKVLVLGTQKYEHEGPGGT